ncbi:hypothetical protein [Ollibium composti]|uniref:Uncharacterized protein n=1 Tax=Ollibium composti TaxID=2675109 RepID=A0ABY2QF32_9HYPH|nr:hypothetical protein [Mesorhizobium composti]THF59867.1 hypothetical protein E6C48_02115 [Mesorhizobium composti]
MHRERFAAIVRRGTELAVLTVSLSLTAGVPEIRAQQLNFSPLCGIFTIPAELSPFLKRPIQNFHAIGAGSKALADFDDDETEQIKALYKLFSICWWYRVPNPSRECADAEHDAAGKAQQAAWMAQSVAACVQRGDLRDDCDAETQELESAQRDYSSATRRFRQECH